MFNFDTKHGSVTIHARASHGAVDIVVRWVADNVVELVAKANAAPITLVVDLVPGERIVGFGERFVEIGQRGRVIDGWIDSWLHGPPESSYYVAPYFHSSTGYALLVDTTSHWTADVGAADSNELVFTVPEPELRARLSIGDPADALTDLVRHFGPPAVPPEWAYGLWVAARSGTAAVIAEARRYLDAGIPVTAVWVDDYYDRRTNSGAGISYPYPTGRYDDIKELTSGLHDLGLRALGYLNCMLYRDTPHHDAMVRAGLAVTTPDGDVHRFRFFHPEHQQGSGDRDWGIVMEDDVAAILDVEKDAGSAAWKSIVESMAADGWDGWMQDFGEQHPSETSHNRYPLLYHQATAAAIAEGSLDIVFFVRSGCIGYQAYAPVTWGGDQGCDWSTDRGLPSLLAAGVSAGLSGTAVWCPDIAGLVELDTDHDRGGQDEELWIRWMQFAAMTPIMRLHLGFKNRDGLGVSVWSSDRTVALFHEYACLHDRLRPYLIHHARLATVTGMPLMRALLIDFPDDDICWMISDQYLLGSSLLVAPVVERGARHRQVYLPRGNWRNHWTGEETDGPGWITVPSPLEQIPMFVRGDGPGPAPWIDER